MSEITIDNVKFTNVPNKKLGTKLTTMLTQSNINLNESVVEYINSNRFYTLLNAIDIDWNGIEVGANSYINNTSDLIKLILSKANTSDLQNYATVSYVGQIIQDLIGAAPDTLDTLEELAYALSYNASLSYVTSALSGKANTSDVYTKQEVNEALAQIELTPGPAGQDGQDGATGADGLSAYQIAVNNGFEGDETAWLNSLKGQDGQNGTNGNDGADGKSAYQLAVDEGYEGTLSQWLESLHGANGTNGINGNDGSDGLSAYQIAVNNGFEGDETAWLASLKGETGTVDYSVLSSYATTSYVTTELDKKANKTDIVQPDYHVEMIIYSGNNYTFTNRPFKVYDSCYLYDTFYFIIYSPEHQVLFDSRSWTGTKDELLTHIKNNYNLEFNSNNEKVHTGYLEIVTLNSYKYCRIKFTEALKYSSIIPDGNLKFSLGQKINYVYYEYATLNYDDFGFRAFVDSILVSDRSSNLSYYYTKSQVKNNFTSYSYINERINAIELTPGATGADGLSAYQIAVNHGFEGDETAWLASLKGDTGATGTVDYSVLNSYVSITSYNALVARVEELASWIVSYHSGGGGTSYTTPDIYFMNPTMSVDYTMSASSVNGSSVTQSLSGTNSTDSAWITWSSSDTTVATVMHGGYVSACGNGTTNIIAYYSAHDNYESKSVQYSLTITNYNSSVTPESKSYPTAQWSYNGNTTSMITIVAGDTTTKSLTFAGTPLSGWTFTDPMTTGVTLNTSTGEVTIDPTNMMQGTYYVYCNYTEDANYYMSCGTLTIKVLAAGTDPDFYYNESSVNLDNSAMSTSSPMYINNTGISGTPTFTSADTSVATVSNDPMSAGMISFVGSGSTTVTATISDGTNTHTATIYVYCTVNKSYATADWVYNGTTYSNWSTLAVVSPFSGVITISGTPSTGWTITDPYESGIVVDNTNGTVTIQGLGEGTMSIYANRNEDSEYNMGSASITLRVLPAGSSTNFYYEQSSINLDNSAMTTQSPMLINNTGIMNSPTYQSNDTSVATVDSMGMISYAGAGTTTVTATITDGTNTYTATITVNCSVMV